MDEGDDTRLSEFLSISVAPEHADGVDAVLARAVDVVVAITDHQDAVGLCGGA